MRGFFVSSWGGRGKCSGKRWLFEKSFFVVDMGGVCYGGGFIIFWNLLLNLNLVFDDFWDKFFVVFDFFELFEELWFWYLVVLVLLEDIWFIFMRLILRLFFGILGINF